MGGLLIVAAASIAFLAVSDRTLPALTIFGTALACGAIGFLDDFIKLRHRRSLGLSGRWKMLLLLAITVAVGFAAHHQKLGHSVFVPIVDRSIPLGPGLVRARVPDHRRRGERREPHRRPRRPRRRHRDHRPLHAHRDGGDDLHPLGSAGASPASRTASTLAFIGAALIGAAIGFLWFNAFPAEVFMGDTGAMALGGAIAAMAIMLKVELLLLLVGGIFAIEALSVIAAGALVQIPGAGASS